MRASFAWRPGAECRSVTRRWSIGLPSTVRRARQSALETGYTGPPSLGTGGRPRRIAQSTAQGRRHQSRPGGYDRNRSPWRSPCPPAWLLWSARRANRMPAPRVCDRARHTRELARGAARDRGLSHSPRQKSVGRETFHSCPPAMGERDGSMRPARSRTGPHRACGRHEGESRFRPRGLESITRTSGGRGETGAERPAAERCSFPPASF